MNNPNDYIGTEDTCHSCGEVKLVVCLDEEELPLCFECATKNMPQERIPKACRAVQQQRALDGGSVTHQSSGLEGALRLLAKALPKVPRK